MGAPGPGAPGPALKIQDWEMRDQMWETPHWIWQRDERDVTGRTDMKDNETIARIRRVRWEISRKVGFDSRRLIEFYKERLKARAAKEKPGRGGDRVRS